MKEHLHLKRCSEQKYILTLLLLWLSESFMQRKGGSGGAVCAIYIAIPLCTKQTLPLLNERKKPLN